MSNLPSITKEVADFIFENLPEINSILSFDLETCGVMPADRIVSFSAVRLERDNYLRAIDYTIDPQCKIPESASAVHGITNEIADTMPPFSHFAPEIFELFQNTDLVIGFNIEGFDIPSLKYSFKEVDENHEFLSFQIKYMDMMNIFKTFERRDLKAAVMLYSGEEIEGHHESLSDAISSVKVMHGQIKKYGIPNLLEFIKNGDAAMVERYIKKDENDVWIYNFGKNKGKGVYDSGLNYLSWIADKSDMPAMLKDFCRKLLKEKPAGVIW